MVHHYKNEFKSYPNSLYFQESDMNLASDKSDKGQLFKAMPRKTALTSPSDRGSDEVRERLTNVPRRPVHLVHCAVRLIGCKKHRDTFTTIANLSFLFHQWLKNRPRQPCKIAKVAAHLITTTLDTF